MGVILGLVTDITCELDDIMWEEIIGDTVVESTVVLRSSGVVKVTEVDPFSVVVSQIVPSG